MSEKRAGQLGAGLEAGVYSKETAKGKAERSGGKSSDYTTEGGARLAANKRQKGAGGKYKLY